MPIPDSFWDIVPGAESFLVSYPRSGSRWMRLLLTDVEFSARGKDTAPVYDFRFQKEFVREEEMDDNAMTIGINVYRLHSGSVERVLREGKPRIFRAHSYTSLVPREWTRCIYIFRNPRAMLRSYIQYAMAEGLLSDDPDEISAFSRGRLNDWIASVDGAVVHSAKIPHRFRMIEYREGTPFSEADLLTVMNECGMGGNARFAVPALERFAEFLKKLNGSAKFRYPRGGADPSAIQSAGHPPLEEELWESVDSVYSRAQNLVTRNRG